jgi:hypothetical protein
VTPVEKRRKAAEAVRRWRAANLERARERDRRWEAANREKRRAKNRAYHAANKEKENAKSRAWHAANRGAENAKSVAWRAANVEAQRVSDRQWAINNPEKRAAKDALRRVRKISATPPWIDRDAIAAIYARAQALKRLTGKKYHVDHIVPLAGANVCGLHVQWNLRVIEAHENQKKSDRLIEELAIAA